MGGFVPMDPLPELCPEPAGDLGGSQTSCLTRKETLVTALLCQHFMRLSPYLHVYICFKLLIKCLTFINNTRERPAPKPILPPPYGEQGATVSMPGKQKRGYPAQMDY